MQVPVWINFKAQLNWISEVSEKKHRAFHRQQG